MRFIADLHIHSRFSRATSKQLTVPSLTGWAARKGIGVLGCGDFTHPAWREELAENLAYDEESGLYRPKTPPQVDDVFERAELAPPLFCLQTEISSIYKRAGKVRKIHNLVFMPHLEAVEKFCRRLEQVGNLHSDGRPILGLDSRDLLEMVLECDERSVLIPAHIWTPWFSLFGSRSGFDSLEECYGDLSSHIFALETGLSSDPAMNRLLSALDNFALVSNSDAHSGGNLGREANLFSGTPSYDGMFAALRAQAGRRKPADADCVFLGTMEFYPEEGKYHLDGHRACNVRLTPAEANALDNICPVCGKPLTIGVLHRVLELADREEAPVLACEPEAKMLIPLAEILAEILGSGSTSRKVAERYSRALRELGPELDILDKIPQADLEKYWEPLGEAIGRMRRGEVRKEAGFDGQFGKIRVFGNDDLRQIRLARLPGTGVGAGPTQKNGGQPKCGLEIAGRPEKIRSGRKASTSNEDIDWAPEQLEALRASGAPIFVEAGPGAGKTRVLVGRIAHLLANGVEARKILAVTFTRRAAEEMLGRLDGASVLLHCDTLHALAYKLRAAADDLPAFSLLNEDLAQQVFFEANPMLDKQDAAALWQEIAAARESFAQLGHAALEALKRYQAAKTACALQYLDYTDLLEWLLQNQKRVAQRFEHVLVDEIQDFSALQMAIVRNLLPPDGQGFFGIGDPDQSIYGFRGAHGQNAAGLSAIWPNLRVFHLSRSFRASQKVLDLAALALNRQDGELRAVFDRPAQLRLFMAPSEESEAIWIAQKIAALLGPTAHSLTDAAAPRDLALAPGDIGILVRLKAQIPVISKMLNRQGIPFQAPAAEEFWHDDSCAKFLRLATEYLHGGSSEPERLPPEKLLAQFAGQETAFPELLGKSAAFATLCKLWRECGSWPKFFEHLAWRNEAELIAQKAQKVRLLTMHSSKGLEFEAVFLPGLEDGILPLLPDRIFPRRAAARQSDLDEERRLFYVGLTRAAKYIYCSACASRMLHGTSLALPPSRFLQNMYEKLQVSHLRRHVRASGKTLSLFDGLIK